jgi:electron transfer flavoprotein alpha subunit
VVGSKAVADQAAKLSGVSKVLVADDVGLANNLAEPLAALIVSLASSYDTILSAATSVGSNVLPSAAQPCSTSPRSQRSPRSSRPHLQAADLCRQRHPDVQSTDAKKVITVRTASFASAAEGGSRHGRDVLVGSSGADLRQDHHCQSAPNIDPFWESTFHA